MRDMGERKSSMPQSVTPSRASGLKKWCDEHSRSSDPGERSAEKSGARSQSASHSLTCDFHLEAWVCRAAFAFTDIWCADSKALGSISRSTSDSKGNKGTTAGAPCSSARLGDVTPAP